MNKIIIANWKSNPDTFEEAQNLFEQESLAAEKYPNAKTIICPPFHFLEKLANQQPTTNNQQLLLGAQDVFWESKPDFSISHVLVGHSLQRYKFGDTDEVINKKLKLALETDIVPVLLIGEREGENREDTLKNQLEKDIADLSADQISKILFCYEPVWAISTNSNGHADTPENALGAVGFIKRLIFENWKLKIENCLYGGSVNENNVADFLKHSEISGAIVGAVSLHANQFSKILETVSNI